MGEGKKRAGRKRRIKRGERGRKSSKSKSIPAIPALGWGSQVAELSAEPTSPEAYLPSFGLSIKGVINVFIKPFE